MQKIYEQALKERYRFYSYGDGMLIYDANLGGNYGLCIDFFDSFCFAGSDSILERV